jgi:hypothetical protein
LLGDFQAPTLRVYPVYTVIAEKYQAMVMLGQANSRMKDFFDLAVIARRTELDGATLATAIAATFARRQTALPTERPLALTQQFSEDAAKLRQWQAFLNKNRIEAASLGDTSRCWTTCCGHRRSQQSGRPLGARSPALGLTHQPTDLAIHMLPSLLAHDIQTALKQFLVSAFEPADAFNYGLMSRFVDDDAWLKEPG